MPYKTLTCQVCDEEYEGWHSSKYCSDECRHVAQTEVIVCGQCGEEFRAEPKFEREYCSKECSGKAQVKNEERECEQCGETFEVKPSSDTVYCSNQCKHRSQRRREERTCAACGDSFEVRPSDEKTHCSRECATESRRETVQVECEHCGDSYETKPAYADGRKYCSRQCAYKARKLRNSVELECPECGDTFRMQRGEWEWRKKEQDRIHCSEECQYQSQQNRVEKVCKQCGEDFSVPASADYREYCSEECYGQSKMLVEGEYQTLRSKKRAEGESSLYQEISSIYDQQNGRCVYCGSGLNEGLHLDHKQPISRGGEHVRENVHLTCAACNLQKHAKTHAEYVDWRRDNGLHVHHLATR